MGNYETIDVDFAGSTYPFNYNPIHAVWQCLLLVGLSESWLHSASFLAAATTIHGESCGISILLNRYVDCLSYLKSLLAHANGILFYGADGKIHAKLIRDDYTVGDLPVVDIDSLLDEPNLMRGSWLETFGEISVQYTQLTEPEEDEPAE